jgi:hypothetical protein
MPFPKVPVKVIEVAQVPSGGLISLGAMLSRVTFSPNDEKEWEALKAEQARSKEPFHSLLDNSKSLSVGIAATLLCGYIMHWETWGRESADFLWVYLNECSLVGTGHEQELVTKSNTFIGLVGLIECNNLNNSENPQEIIMLFYEAFIHLGEFLLKWHPKNAASVLLPMAALLRNVEWPPDVKRVAESAILKASDGDV